MLKLTYVIDSDHIDEFREMISETLLDDVLKEHFECGYSSGMWVSGYVSKEKAKKIDKSFEMLVDGKEEILDKRYIEDEEDNYYEDL